MVVCYSKDCPKQIEAIEDFAIVFDSLIEYSMNRKMAVVLTVLVVHLVFPMIVDSSYSFRLVLCYLLDNSYNSSDELL